MQPATSIGKYDIRDFVFAAYNYALLSNINMKNKLLVSNVVVENIKIFVSPLYDKHRRSVGAGTTISWYVQSPPSPHCPHLLYRVDARKRSGEVM